MCYNHVEFYGLRSAYQIVLLTMTESKQEMGSCYTRVCVCVCVCVRVSLWNYFHVLVRFIGLLE